MMISFFDQSLSLVNGCQAKPDKIQNIMSNTDPYETLGLSKSATADEISKAYKKMVRQYHPDAKPDDKEAAEKFKEIQNAYAILGDEKKRAQYDQFGSTFPGGGGTGGNPFGGGAGAGADFDLGDIFGAGGGGIDLNDIFGSGGMGRGQRRSAPPRRGEDIHMEVQIPFNVAAEGGEWDVNLNKGSGPETLTAKIPAGIESGQKIRLTGQGHPGSGGAGNLILTVRVAKHPWFRRETNNLLLELPLTPAEAALGTKVPVPTLSDGEVTLTIPAGASSGTRLRLREKGIIDRKTKKQGDQYVIVKIIVPKELDQTTQELYEKLQKADSQNIREGLWE